MTAQSSEWERLAQFLSAQRVRVNAAYSVRARWIEYTEPLGLSRRVVNDLESARRTNYKSTTLALAEKLYKIREGWIEEALEAWRNGEEAPEDYSALSDMRPLVDPTEEPPGRPDPVLHMVGIPPLEPHEQITARPQGEGRLVYDFVTRAQHPDGSMHLVEIRLTYPTSDSLESVVARLRKNAKGLYSG